MRTTCSASEADMQRLRAEPRNLRQAHAFLKKRQIRHLPLLSACSPEHTPSPPVQLSELHSCRAIDSSRGMQYRRFRVERSIAHLSTVLLLGTVGGAAQAAPASAQSASLPHRLSAYVAPIGYATFTGDFGRDNPRVSNEDFTENAPVFAAGARYGSRIVDGLELGAGLEFIKPYGEPSGDGTVQLRLNALNAALYVRPYLVHAGGRVEFGVNGRIGVATGFWGSSLMGPGWTLAGGADVRVALNDNWALEGEVSLSAFQIRHGGSEPRNASLRDVSAIGFALLPSLSLTYAF